MLSVPAEEIYFLGYRPGSTDVLTGVGRTPSGIPNKVPPTLEEYGLDGLETWTQVPDVLTFINCDDLDLEVGKEIFDCLMSANLNPWLQQQNIEFGEHIPTAFHPPHTQ